MDPDLLDLYNEDSTLGLDGERFNLLSSKKGNDILMFRTSDIQSIHARKSAPKGASYRGECVVIGMKNGETFCLGLADVISQGVLLTELGFGCPLTVFSIERLNS